MLITGADIVHQMDRLIASGARYRLGSEARLEPGAGFPPYVDCSEAIQWAFYQLGVDAPDGTPGQYQWCRSAGRIIAVDQAIETEGAGLFTYLGPHNAGGMGNHVAISAGDGTTREARSTLYGVGSWDAYGRGWTHGVLWPPIDYQPEDQMSPAEMDLLAEKVGAAVARQLDARTRKVHDYATGQEVETNQRQLDEWDSMNLAAGAFVAQGRPLL